MLSSICIAKAGQCANLSLQTVGLFALFLQLTTRVVAHYSHILAPTENFPFFNAKIWLKMKAVSLSLPARSGHKFHSRSHDSCRHERDAVEDAVEEEGWEVHRNSAKERIVMSSESSFPDNARRKMEMTSLACNEEAPIYVEDADLVIGPGSDLLTSSTSAFKPVVVEEEEEEDIDTTASTTGRAEEFGVIEEMHHAEMRTSVVDVVVEEEGNNVGGPTNLHPIFEASLWQRLYECLQDLELNYFPEAIREAFTEISPRDETVLHVAAWKAPPLLCLMMLELLSSSSVSERKEMFLIGDGDGNTPLHLACANLDERLDFSVIKNILLLAPEALEMTNLNGDTPLHLLVASAGFRQSHNFEAEVAAEEAITSLLLMAGHLATVQNYQGATLLHTAIGSGSHERVLVKLLSMAPEAVEISDVAGMLPLHYVAAFRGTPWTFAGQLIQTCPSSISAQTLHGDTPLHLLMTNAKRNFHATGDDTHEEEEEEETEEENQVQYIDRHTTKLVELLAGSGEEEMSPMLLPNHGGFTPLHCAALFDPPSQLTRILMENPLAGKASVQTTDEGETALHLLCGSETVSDMLENVRALASPEACSVGDCKCRTALVVAVQNKKVCSSVVKALTNAMPELARTRDHKDAVPLHYAVKSRKVKLSVVRGEKIILEW
jgi:ankyrin repeat protein